MRMNYYHLKLTGCGLTAATWDEPTQSWDLVLRVPEPQLRLFVAALETDDAVRRYHEERIVTPPELECSDDVTVINDLTEEELQQVEQNSRLFRQAVARLCADGTIGEDRLTSKSSRLVAVKDRLRERGLM